MQGSITGAFIGEKITAHQTKLQIGAHAIFLGQVRADRNDLGTVHSIFYSAHESMAQKCISSIREDIITKYGLTCMHVYHSLGSVEVGGISLFVFTSSAHREACQKACAEAVERIKREVPIWGKEILEDGNYFWKQNVT